METALNPKFQQNHYHEALYQWHVETKRDITCPTQSPYYDSSVYEIISKVKEEGILNIKTMTAAMWYRVMTEDNITHTPTGDLVPCKIELKYPEVDWKRSWSLAVTPGLSTKQLTFIWRMVHDLLPSQVRLFRLGMPNISTDICSHCNNNMLGNLTHSLMLCPYNDGAGQFLLSKLNPHIQHLTPEKVLLLDFEVAKEYQLPVMFLVATVLSDIWDCRKHKKPCHLHTIRAALEAGINILRKSRNFKAAITLDNILI